MFQKNLLCLSTQMKEAVCFYAILADIYLDALCLYSRRQSSHSALWNLKSHMLCCSSRENLWTHKTSARDIIPAKEHIFMSWYVQHFRIPVSHGISGVHLFTIIHLLLCWLVCGMEATAFLSEVQWCPLKLPRLQHKLDIVLNLCIISFIRLATVCFLNKHQLICIYEASLHDKQYKCTSIHLYSWCYLLVVQDLKNPSNF